MSSTLVLNRSFNAIQVINWQKSISLIYTGHANVIDLDYSSYNFSQWSEISKSKSLSGTEHVVHSASLTLVVPDVISLLFYDRLPPQDVILTRESIFARDHFRCYYCGEQHKRIDLTWDHIIPRSKGGVNSWLNLCTCCYSCNQAKAGKTPAEAGMKLLWEPKKPQWKGKIGITLGSIKAKHSWKKFVDEIYWNAELTDE